MIKAIAASKKRIIAKAIIIGLVLTLLTLVFEYKTTVTEYNDCVGICTAYVTAETEAEARGYPVAIVTTTSPGASFEETEFSILGAVVDWILYSFVALIVIVALTRIRKPHS